MGMDVYGTQPTDPQGEYFRANVWAWHPLWQYVEAVHPDIADLVPLAHSNDGDGLDAMNSKELSRLLFIDLSTGVTDEYEATLNAELAKIKPEPCSYCDGTGQRTDWPADTTPEWIAQCNGCNACRGTGELMPWTANYQFNKDLLKKFATFLEYCGGFEIC